MFSPHDIANLLLYMELACAVHSVQFEMILTLFNKYCIALGKVGLLLPDILFFPNKGLVYDILVRGVILHN